MWFKNLLAFRITDVAAIALASIETELAKRAFVPAGKSDRLTAGWTSPAAHAPDLLAYPCQGALLIALKTEEKLLPAAVVKQAADERIAEIEGRELRKIGKKEAREIRERMAEELLPRAFSRTRILRALIDPIDGWVLVDTAAPAKAELLVQYLRETLGTLPTKLPQTQLDPVTAMSTWLEHEAPDGFTLDADAKMQAPGGGAKVAVAHHDLNADEVKLHLQNGKLVTQLAMSWDDRISFLLTEKLQIKRLAFLDLIQDRLAEADAEDAAALFDASLLIQIEEGRKLVAAVIEALGGELSVQSFPPSKSPTGEGVTAW